jgi:hypothetical protein
VWRWRHAWPTIFRSLTVASTSERRNRADFNAVIYSPEVRRITYQVVLLALLAFAAVWVVSNVAENLRRQNIASLRHRHRPALLQLAHRTAGDGLR